MPTSRNTCAYLKKLSMETFHPSKKLLTPIRLMNVHAWEKKAEPPFIVSVLRIIMWILPRLVCRLTLLDGRPYICYYYAFSCILLLNRRSAKWLRVSLHVAYLYTLYHPRLALTHDCICNRKGVARKSRLIAFTFLILLYSQRIPNPKSLEACQARFPVFIHDS